MQKIMETTGPHRRTAPVVAAALAVVLLGLTNAAVCQPQYSMFRYDQQRTGRSLFAAAEDPSVSWTYDLGGICSATPVIAEDGTAYFGAFDKYFYAIAGDGTLRWRYRTRSSVRGGAAIGPDGVVYFATLSGKLHALNPDGSAKWDDPFSFGLLGAAGSLLLADNGTLYFGSDDSRVHAVGSDGTLKWSYQTGGPIKHAVAMSRDGSTIYAASEDGRIYAIGSDGALKWKSGLIQPATGCAVADDGSIYVGSQDGTFYALGSDGSVRWTYRAWSRITSAPAIGWDGTVYFGSQDSNLYALGADGSLKWHYDSQTALYSSPTIDPLGALVFGTWSGKLMALSTTDGSTLWTRHLGTTISASPVIGAEPGLGTIYVLDGAGNLTKFTGEVTPEPSSLVALGSALLCTLGLVGLRRRRRASGQHMD